MNEELKRMALVGNDEQLAGIYNSDYINTDGNEIHKTAIIHDNVRLGKGNVIGAHTVIGSNGEMRKPKYFKGTVRGFQRSFKGLVIIGDNNVISELVTIQCPKDEGQVTVIGNDNIIMAHSHVGHDAKIGNECEICTGTIIGGYANILDGAIIKLGCTIRNRVTVGIDSLVGMGSVVVKDVFDGATVYGNPAK
jgi:UDP-N-acetylglucosamine acyltransferase